MKKYIIFIFLGFILISCNKEIEIKIEYLDEYEVNQNGQIYAENLISNKGIEFSPSFSKDGEYFYYVKSDSLYSKYQIVKVRYVSGNFKRIELNLENFDRPFTPFPYDGKLYFANLDSLNNSKLYYLENDLVTILDSNINKGSFNGFLSISDKGTICFESNRDGGFGQGDIYLAKLNKDGSYKVQNVGENINTKLNESDAFISPDEKYIIYTAYDYKDSFGSSDLYISYLGENGEYSKGINLGSKVNSEGLEHNPHISPDGKYLFYSSSKKVEGEIGPGNGNFDIYWISTSEIKNIAN